MASAAARACWPWPVVSRTRSFSAKASLRRLFDQSLDSMVERILRACESEVGSDFWARDFARAIPIWPVGEAWTGRNWEFCCQNSVSWEIFSGLSGSLRSWDALVDEAKETRAMDSRGWRSMDVPKSSWRETTRCWFSIFRIWAANWRPSLRRMVSVC